LPNFSLLPQFFPFFSVTAQDWSSSTLDGPPFREVSSASVLGSTSAIVLPSSTIIDLEQHSSGPVLMTETVVGQHDFTTIIGKDVMVFTSPPPGRHTSSPKHTSYFLTRLIDLKV
jgi:hypothetical protein